MLVHNCRGADCWCRGPVQPDPSITLRPGREPVLVAPSCPHGAVGGHGCYRCMTERIAALEAEVAHHKGQVESWQRVFGQLGEARDTILAQHHAALREVARLEALIVEAVVSAPEHVPDCIYDEAEHIRSRKP